MKNILKSVMLLALIILVGCTKDQSNEPNDINNAENFDCVNGDCVGVDSDGTYSSLSDCLSNCSESNTSQTFNCVNGGCVIAGTDGEYSSLADCENNCDNTSGSDTPDCINGDCVNVGANGTFTSFSDCQTNCVGESSFTDPRDGQTYAIVKIGNQTWFAENLRYSQNIPHKSGDSWADNWNNATELPAWCLYNDNSSNNSVYGKLYNWYAVRDSELCPTGWHIPTYDEWKNLFEFLGGQPIAGGKMKFTLGWDAPNTDATNSSGFTGLPGGFRRGSSSESISLGVGGFWWSSTAFSATNAWNIFLGHDRGDAVRVFGSKLEGYSCRCIKD